MQKLTHVPLAIAILFVQFVVVLNVFYYYCVVLNSFVTLINFAYLLLFVDDRKTREWRMEMKNKENAMADEVQGGRWEGGRFV